MATFSGSRLSLARRKNGLTQTKLAQICGVQQAYISQLENNSEEEPTASFMEQLSEHLGVPTGFFQSGDIENIPVDGPSFRARRKMSAKVRDLALATCEAAIEIVSPDINRRFVLPELTIPDLSGISPEDAANLLRLEWKLGYEPIVNMVYLLEAKGVEIYWHDADNPSLDGFAFWRNKPFVLINSHITAGDRMRFTLAHELGHLVLHQDEEVVDGREIEDEANQFAAAFLLPAEQFAAESPDRPNLEYLAEMKKRWKVSIQAMIMRGRSLEIFSEWQTRQAFKLIAALGMRQREPVLLPPEESFLHKRTFEALQKRGMDPGDYSRELRLPKNYLLELMPLAQRFLPAGQREIRRGHLKLLAKSDDV